MSENIVVEQIIQMKKSPEYLSLSAYYAKKSIFEILKISREEKTHSNFIAWLLDPKSDHGLGTFPMECFLNMLIIRNSETGVVPARLKELCQWQAWNPAQWFTDYWLLT